MLRTVPLSRGGLANTVNASLFGSTHADVMASEQLGFWLEGAGYRRGPILRWAGLLATFLSVLDPDFVVSIQSAAAAPD